MVVLLYIDVNQYANPKKGSHLVAQGAESIAQVLLVAPIPHPLPDLLRLHQSGLGQDLHVVGDGWLRKLNLCFNVTGAHPYRFINGAASLLLQQGKDSPAGRISDGGKHGTQLGTHRQPSMYIAY